MRRGVPGDGDPKSFLDLVSWGYMGLYKGYKEDCTGIMEKKMDTSQEFKVPPVSYEILPL